MDKYKELRAQVLGELKWTINSINKKNPGKKQIPDDIRLIDLLGDYKDIEPEDRGNLFSYLSIKSKIDYLDSEEYEYEEEAE